MKILIILLILNTIISCGKFEDVIYKDGESSPYIGMGIDVRLMPYMDVYKNISGTLPTYPIIVAEIKTLGVCITYPNGDRVIIIDPSNFDGDEYNFYLEYIVLHEIGHCTYGRKHDLTILNTSEGQRYKTIMYPYIMNVNIYINNREYYLNEFINHNININEYFTLNNT